MTYVVQFRPAAARALRKLPNDVRRRIQRVTDGLAHHPRPRTVRALSGQPGRLRLRVGDYRVIYRVHDDVLLVVVIEVGHQCDIYDR